MVVLGLQRVFGWVLILEDDKMDEGFDQNVEERVKAEQI
jgi:hypothetical protein